MLKCVCDEKRKCQKCILYFDKIMIKKAINNFSQKRENMFEKNVFFFKWMLMLIKYCILSGNL